MDRLHHDVKGKHHKAKKCGMIVWQILAAQLVIQSNVTAGIKRLIAQATASKRSFDRYILLDVLLCSIAEYFYELCRILASP